MGLNDKLVKAGITKVGVQGGLHARMSAAKQLGELVGKPDPSNCEHKLAIIADFSGSMDGAGTAYVIGRPDPPSKLKLLSDAIQDFTMRSDESTTAIAVESFPEGFRINLTNDKNEIWMKMFNIRTIGDTPMGRGMSNALEYHNPTRTMMISDGGQTDGEAPFEMARKYKEKSIICDTIHIGSDASGEATLKKIAEITGGMYMKFKDVQNFADAFHFLLPGSRETIAGMLPAERQRLLGSDQ